MPAEVPFQFVVAALEPLPIRVQAFFGGHMVYLATPAGERMLFLLYDRKRWPRARGVWLASELDNVAELERRYPVQPVPIDEFTLKGWRMIAADSDAFESTIADWVERIKSGDPCMGRFAPPRKRRKTVSRTSAESF